MKSLKTYQIIYKKSPKKPLKIFKKIFKKSQRIH